MSQEIASTILIQEPNEDSHPIFVMPLLFIFSLESILFAILIGISCDFIIHFAHAYAVLPGQKSREDRTLFCLLSMGPSILAAAFTTFAAACVMLGTVITFFEKFAVVLFVTVIQALLGSFVVFLTMAITMGPSEPTYLVDRAVEKCRQVLCRK